MGEGREGAITTHLQIKQASHVVDIKSLGKGLGNHRGLALYQASLLTVLCGHWGSRPWGLRGFCMAKHLAPSLAHRKALLGFS